MVVCYSFQRGMVRKITCAKIVIAHLGVIGGGGGGGVGPGNGSILIFLWQKEDHDE